MEPALRRAHPRQDIRGVQVRRRFDRHHQASGIGTRLHRFDVKLLEEFVVALSREREVERFGDLRA